MKILKIISILCSLIFISSCQYEGVPSQDRFFGITHAGYSMSDTEYSLLNTLGVE